MAVALQIRDVPEDVRDVIAERAAQLGQSMQVFLLNMVEREARLARNAKMFERTAAHRVAISDDQSPERIVREGREAGFDVDRGAR